MARISAMRLSHIGSSDNPPWPSAKWSICIRPNFSANETLTCADGSSAASAGWNWNNKKTQKDTTASHLRRAVFVVTEWHLLRLGFSHRSMSQSCYATNAQLLNEKERPNRRRRGAD